VSILVWVNRPVTSDGLIFKVTPFALDVEMFALNIFTPVPPVKVPPAPMAQDAAVAVALKLPLDWARASPDPNVAINAAVENDTNLFILFTFGLPLCVFDSRTDSIKHTTGVGPAKKSCPALLAN